MDPIAGRERAAGIILYHRGPDAEPHYLLLRNAKHGTWGFPKGHTEPGETDDETAHRETLEETGVSTVDLHPSFREEITYAVRTRHGHVLKTVVLFLGSTPDRTVVRSSEHDEVRWSAFDEARGLLLHRDLLTVLDRARRALSSSEP